MLNKLEKAVLTLLLALGAAFGAAQDTAQPADPFAPTTETAEPAPEIPDVAWVRFAHFSPNADEISVDLRPTSEDVAFTGEGFGTIPYQSLSGYMEIPAGNYTVTAQGGEAADALEEELSFARGNHYTLSAIGMVLPPEVRAEEADEEEEGGFVAFFRNLFGNGDADRDRLALQFHLIEDDLTRVPNEGETLIRVVHAAPGTEPIDLAVMGEQGTIVNDVEFGNSSRYAGYEGGMEQLEVRLSGSRAATLELTNLNLQAGNLNTIYVVGTPVEQAPIAVLGSSLAPVEVGMAAGEDVAADVVDDGETAGGGAADDAEEADDAAEDGEGAEDGDATDDAAGETDEAADDAADDTGDDTGDDMDEEEPATDEEGAEEPATDEEDAEQTD
ncbi:MAG: DUF4397 domain-containing protein [Trueperaceae bacterium]